MSTEEPTYTSLKETISQFDGYKLPQKSVNLLDYSTTISYDQTNVTCANLKDRTAFSHKYAEDLSNIAELEELIEESNYYIHTLYTYRSISKPLPMIPADLSDTEKTQLYKTVFNILTPNIRKIKAMLEFHDRFIRTFVKNLRLLIFPMEKKEVFWNDHIKLLIHCVDKFFILDFLKDVKGQIKNDFSRYKRAFSFVRSTLNNAGELMAEITEIHNFLNDATHHKHMILYQLRCDVGAVPHRETLFAMMVNKAIEWIKNEDYVTPNQKHSIYRGILGCIYLCDDSNASLNIFKSKYFKIHKIRDVLKRLPIVPVFMDIHTTIEYSLLMCDNYTQDMQWMDRKHHKTYDLIRWRKCMQSEYTSFSVSFVKFLHSLKGNNKEDGHAYGVGFELIIRGMKLLGEWTSRLKEQIAYKSANPISESEYESFGGNTIGDNPYKSYEKITRFNYSNELKYTMVEVIGLIKGLSNMLLSNESKIRSVLSYYVQFELQQFVHKTLIWPLNKAFKKKKQELQHLMVSMRMTVADNENNLMLKSDYKTKKDKDIKQCINQYDYIIKKNERCLYPSKTQILLLRRLLMELFSDESHHQQSGVFASNFLSKAQVKVFSDLYNLLGNTLYISNYKQTINECCDLSSLWYREFHLNLTNVIQFPISMSIPWMLTDFAMSTPSLAPNVFFPLSIYNDCAETALSIYSQQHLFDEIEAEVNLVFDQLMFTLYRKIFDYFKNIASKILLDNTIQYKLENGLNRNNIHLGQQFKLPLARYQCIFNQKHLNILGRCVDIESLLTEQLNSFIRENIEVIITRYETSKITSCIEISHLLKTLKLTVEMLREELPSIDPFDDMLSEVNEDTTLGSFRGRLFLETYNKVFSKLLRHYIFNQLTHRFVSLEKRRSKKKGKRRTDTLYLWGSRFTQIYQERFKVTTSFFGSEHVECMLEMLGVDSIPLLVDEAVKTVAHIIIRDISPYVEEILKNLDPMKTISINAYYGVLGVYGYYDLSLKYIKQYPALREGVFTLLREAGNALGFIQMLDIVLTKESYYNHRIQSFYKGNHDLSKLLSEKLSNDKLKLETDLLKSCINSAIQREQFLTTNSGGWLLSATLQYLHKNLVETGLLKKWKGPIPNNGILEHDNPKDFSRFWSVATFIFLVPDDPNDIISNRAQFGDGWLWAGITILYLTNLIHRYKLLDPTIYLDKLQRLYPANLEESKSTAFGGLFKGNKNKNNNDDKLDPKTDAYKPFVKQLLNGWHQMENDFNLILSILKSHFVLSQEPITRFTPKFSD